MNWQILTAGLEFSALVRTSSLLTLYCSTLVGVAPLKLQTVILSQSFTPSYDIMILEFSPDAVAMTTSLMMSQKCDNEASPHSWISSCTEILEKLVYNDCDELWLTEETRENIHRIKAAELQRYLQ